MKIKNQKDFWSGVMFVVVGLGFAIGATNYSLGPACVPQDPCATSLWARFMQLSAKPGAGFFPLGLGLIQALLGAVVLFKALTIETEGGDPIGAIPWKPLLLIVAVLALFVWPWANKHSAELKERFERRSDLSRVAPGQFQTSNDGRRVFFIERDVEDSRVGRNVFILSMLGETESVTTARSGRTDMTGDDRFLVLDRGQRNEQDLRDGSKTLSRFETYRVLAGERVSTRATEPRPKARASIDLLRNPTPRHQGDLAWRFGLLLGAANLLLCPNLDAANILFNVLKVTASQGVTIGPILLGAAAPVHILTPSATMRRVVNMTALAVADAAALAEAGGAAPSFRRTGLSPQISSRW